MSKMKKFTSSFRTRSFRVGGYSVAATAIVLAIIIIANLLIGALPTAVTELDITANNLYSISQQTKDILKSLDRDVTLYWICQAGVEDTPLQTLLERYSTGSARVKLERIDPDLNPTFIQSYSNEELDNNGVIVASGDRYRYVDPEDIYLEEIDYETYQYVYDFDGENALTSAIDYVVSDDLPQIALLTGHGEAELSDTYSRAVSLENFETRTLSLLAQEAVPEDIDILMIYAPTEDISQEEAQKISAFLSQGGDLMLISIPTLTETHPNLFSVIADYGVSAVEGILFDPDPQYNYYGYTHYLLPTMNEHSITEPMLSSNLNVMLPEAHGLVIDENLPGDITVTSLLDTSDSAYAKTSVDSTETADSGATGKFSLATAIRHTLSEDTASNIVWVACPQLMDTSVNNAVSGGNLDFFMNSLNWMCEHEERISIRPKDRDAKYLTINSSSATAMTVLVVAMIPLCYLGVGVYIFIRRKRK